MAKTTKVKETKLSVVLKEPPTPYVGRDHYAVVVLTGTNNIQWRSATSQSRDITKKLANTMAKVLGTKVIDQT